MDEHQSASLIYGPHLQSNLSTVFSIKFLTAVFSGATAGVMGLTNLEGFFLFALSTIFCASLVVMLKCGSNPKMYLGDGKGISTQGALLQLLIPGMDNVFGFILTWTLLYGVIHVYD